MNNTPRSMTAPLVQAERQKAREEILLRLLRGGATGAELRDELAARCGSARVIDVAREWLRANGLIRLEGTHSGTPIVLTDQGRQRAEEIRDQRAAEKGRAA